MWIGNTGSVAGTWTERGTSVVMVVGYLTGLSHMDPLAYDLPLEHFMPEDMAGPPDIDLDFPRDIRELGRTLGLPSEEIGQLAKIIESRVRGLADELPSCPATETSGSSRAGGSWAASSRCDPTPGRHGDFLFQKP